MPYAIVLLFLLCALPAEAQQFVFPLKHFDTRDGLPSAEVYEVLQDRRGFIWFGTDKGVVRFDGTRFRVFTTEDGLTDNTVFKLFEDAKGRLWMCGLSHLLCYFQDDTIVAYPHNAVIDRHIDKADVSTFIWVDSLGTVYLADQLHPGYYAISAGGVFSVDTTRVALHPEYGLYALGDKRQELPHRFPQPWLPALAGLEQVVEAHNPRMNLNLLLRSAGEYPVAFASYYPHTYFRYAATRRWETHHAPAPVLCFTQDQSGNRWMGTYTGGLWLEGAHEQPMLLLPDHTISDVFQDRYHGLWISTVQSGVYYLANPAVRASTVMEGLRQGPVKAIIPQHHAVIFVTHDDYAYHFDTLTRQLRPLPSNWKIDIDAVPVDMRRQGVAFYNMCYATRTEKKVIGLQQPDESTCIVSNNNNIFKFQDGRLVLQSADFLSGRFNHALQDDAGNLWIASQQGLLCIRGDKTLEQYSGRFPVLGQRIQDIKINPFGGLILGSRGNGLLFFDGDTLKTFTEADGLPSNTVNQLYLEHPDRLWVATNKGVAQLSLAAGAPCRVLRYINAAHGLVSRDVRQICRWGNYLCLGTDMGVEIIELGLLPINHMPPPVFFENIRVNEQPVALNDTIDLRIPYAQRLLTCRFATLNFRNRDQTWYRYRLLGFDTAWTRTQKNELTFHSLPPGDYCLEIAAQNEDGFWSTAPLTLKFCIEAPYWLRWPFWVLVGTGVLAISGYWFRQYQRRQAQKMQIQEQMSQFRHTALNAQMNDHFLFNTLNSIQNFILKNNAREAVVYLSRFSRLVRLTLDLSPNTFICLKKMLEITCLYLDLEALRFDQKFSYEIQIQEQIDPEDCYVPNGLLQPFLENAVWHGFAKMPEQGLIQVKFERREDRLHIMITDNGIGRAAAKALQNSKHTPQGISLTREKMDVLAGILEQSIKINIEDLHAPSGTRVHIEMPYITGNYPRLAIFVNKDLPLQEAKR